MVTALISSPLPSLTGLQATPNLSTAKFVENNVPGLAHALSQATRITHALEGCKISPALMAEVKNHKFPVLFSGGARVCDRHMALILSEYSPHLMRLLRSYGEGPQPHEKRELKKIPLEILYLHLSSASQPPEWLETDLGIVPSSFSELKKEVTRRFRDELLKASMNLDCDLFLQAFDRYVPRVIYLSSKLQGIEVSSDLRDIFRPGFNADFARGIPALEGLIDHGKEAAQERISSMFEHRHARIHAFRGSVSFYENLDTYYMDPRLLLIVNPELRDWIKSSDDLGFTYGTLWKVIDGRIVDQLAPRHVDNGRDISDTLHGAWWGAWSSIVSARVKKAAPILTSSARIAALLML